MPTFIAGGNFTALWVVIIGIASPRNGQDGTSLPRCRGSGSGELGRRVEKVPSRHLQEILSSQVMSYVGPLASRSLRVSRGVWSSLYLQKTNRWQ